MIELRASIAAYEDWMRQQIRVVEDDLKAKHIAMAQTPFAFLRATCARFAETCPALLPNLLRVATTPSVGDAHLENFGTWRDAEGRLIWGVNDLDEAARLPWTLDLLRLATSALLTPNPPHATAVAEALLAGHAQRLLAPCPFVLDAGNAALREAAAPSQKERERFWARVEALAEALPPPDIAAALRAALPPDAQSIRMAPRRAGLGSLGRPRFVACADWRGGPIAREAKVRIPSAFLYAKMPGAQALEMAGLATAKQRAPDPWFQVTSNLTLRRLAPDSRKIEWGDGVPLTDLLAVMGGELGNFHALGDAAAIAEEKAALPAGWLRHGAHRLADAVRADHAAWR